MVRINEMLINQKGLIMERTDKSLRMDTFSDCPRFMPLVDCLGINRKDNIPMIRQAMNIISKNNQTVELMSFLEFVARSNIGR